MKLSGLGSATPIALQQYCTVKYSRTKRMNEKMPPSFGHLVGGGPSVEVYPEHV